MKSTVADNFVVLPQALWAEVQVAAADERRTAGDIVRDLVEQGLNARRSKQYAARARERARAAGLPDEDAPPMDDYRQVARVKIAQGAQSLRDGKGTDGESFMAAMDAELAELERQGHK